MCPDAAGTVGQNARQVTEAARKSGATGGAANPPQLGVWTTVDPQAHGLKISYTKWYMENVIVRGR